MTELCVDEAYAGERLDLFLAGTCDLTRTAAQKLIEQELVTVNHIPRDKKYRLSTGEIVRFEQPALAPLEAVPQDIPLSIVYEDDDVIVVNKPKGMVVHPAPGHLDGTLVNALLHHCAGTLSGINGVIRPGIVHRIDKDTSGLLLVAKTDRAHVHLAAQIKEHSLARFYEAIVIGRMKETEGTINAPIGRNPADRKKMAVRADGRPAVTHYRVIRQYDGFAHLKLQLETGRTHQIRVHMAAMGRPVLGDLVYGNGKNSFEKKNASILCGQCLHAKAVGFTHVNGETLYFESDLPEYFQTILTKLNGNKNDESELGTGENHFF
ncbi:MAG: RluA family pseudouridine synthase [Clostridiales bacterium]|nr:RluA family pseudouridine synthase [Clostridiales bacterium]